MPLPVYHSITRIDPDRLFESVPLTPIARDWYGAPCAALSFFVALDPTTLHLGAKVRTAPYHDPAARGFVEGLAERYNVIELFLLEDHSSRYQEFHVSPSGAWWSEGFSNYRTREFAHELSSAEVVTHASSDASSFQASLSFPRSRLLVSSSFAAPSRANVTVIIGKNPRQYISFAAITGEPDFHRCDQFDQWEAHSLAARN